MDTQNWYDVQEFSPGTYQVTEANRWKISMSGTEFTAVRWNTDRLDYTEDMTTGEFYCDTQFDVGTWKVQNAANLNSHVGILDIGDKGAVQMLDQLRDGHSEQPSVLRYHTKNREAPGLQLG